jgi:nitrate/TMAO reductase-like tetraheme cytochrome c subunit
MKIFKAIRSKISTTIDIKKILKSKWVIFSVGPLFILIGVVLVTWVGHTLTSYSVICLSCHAKQTGLSMWAPSAIHPARVTCVNCHAKPYQLFPRDFFADDKMNKNCLFCHKPVAEKGIETADHMKIDHKLHTEEAKLMCIDCHRNIEHDKTEAGTNHPSHLTCIECHEEAISRGPESCMKCHTEIPGTSSS